jgi:hypothetical protein
MPIFRPMKPSGLSPRTFQEKIFLWIRWAFAVKQGHLGGSPMQNRLVITASAWLLLACCGCCIGPTVDTVPWWKGLPSMLIEPTSLEAMVWRDHLRAKHSSTFDARPPQRHAYNFPEDSGPLEQIPLPAVQPRPLLPTPEEATGSDHRLRESTRARLSG